MSLSQPAPLSCCCTELSAESVSACHGSWLNDGGSPAVVQCILMLPKKSLCITKINIHDLYVPLDPIL